MDAKIRNLLLVAENNPGGKQGGPALQQAYELMRNVAETKPAVDTPESFSQDLYVVCAELTFQTGQTDLARECLKMYFMKTPPTNQFLCRAYLCQAQLLAPTTAANSEQLEKAVVYLLKAINMSKENPRYHFLVYNASVLYWKFCRPFLRPGYRQYLARSLHQVVMALDAIDDKDTEWRAQLMIALIECHMDAAGRSNAAQIATAAASFIKQHVPALYKTVFGLMVRHQLVESTKLSKDIKSSPELSMYYKICRLKLAIEQRDSEKDVHEEMLQIASQISGKVLTKSTQAAADNTSEQGGSKSPTRRGRSATPTGSTKCLGDTPEKPFLLLELGRLALEQNYPDVGQYCVDIIKECAHLIKDPSFMLETEFLQVELMVKSLGDKQESYKKAIVDVRCQAIKRCDEAIVNAVRLLNPNVLQAGCVTQWNLCLPLLQPNLRHHCRRPLTTIATALEDINSLLMTLRCQVHLELAKCEEDQEQIAVAMTHLKKALSLDDGRVYAERLEVALHRLELRSQLYQTPNREEDHAAMIIEQARKADSGTIRMKRSLLVRAGQALAPDAFLLVLDSESDTKAVTSGKGPLTQIKKLAGRAQQFVKATSKAAGHLRRLGDENDRERARLWGDLAKTARKQEVWDVCRVAARFCLLYDDGRWKNEPPRGATATIPAEKVKSEKDVGGEVEGVKSSLSKASMTASRPVTPEPQVNLYDKDLIRMMAEVNFINGEALIHLLRSEGVEIGDLPVAPRDTRTRPKGYVAKKPEEDPDWIDYCAWIQSLSADSTSAFLRAVALGRELCEPWIVCSAASYVWNYNNHRLRNDYSCSTSTTRHKEITQPLLAVLEGLQDVGHACETSLLVSICRGLAIGLMQPWRPPPVTRDFIAPTPPPELKTESGRSSAKKKAPAAAAAKTTASKHTISTSSEATADLKKAVEVCEYAMRVTNGDQHLDVVPISIRYPLLQTWVQAKQMLQSQISKGMGTDDESSQEGQDPMTRAMVATEMLSVNGNGIFEFKETPTLNHGVEMVSACSWTELLVELQLWTRLAYLGLGSKQHNIVTTCALKALAFAETGTSRKKRRDEHKYMVEQEMLSYASSIYGQSLVATAQGKNSQRRKAMKHFVNSAKFAAAACNSELVTTATRHYWNAALALITQPIERELQQPALTSLLDSMNQTMKKQVSKKEEGADDVEEVDTGAQLLPIDVNAEIAAEDAAETETKKPMGIIGGPEDDLTLRAALYGVLFQCFADKGKWEDGLKAMDKAIQDMPRTNHRLLIFKHMVLVRAKLGLNVQMSIQKFKDSSEDYVAHMWRRVALCSKDQAEQLSAYQYAIEALTSPDSDWQKFDYLLEFGQWLFCNEFPLTDAIDQLEWAVDILLNFKYEVKVKPVEEVKGKGKGAKGKKEEVKKSPPASPSKAVSKKLEDKKAEALTEVPSAVSLSGSEKGSQDGINASDFIPVKKDAIIGVLPENPSLTVSDLTDVRQLEGLFRAHCLLAEMSGRSSLQHKDYVIMAHGYIMRIWNSALTESGPVMKEIAKNPQLLQESSSRKSSPTGKPGKADPKKKDAPPVAVKKEVKRKGPLESVPANSDEWSTYDVPDEVLEAFSTREMKTTGINKYTIDKPLLSLHYLGVLSGQLHELGYSHLRLPVLALAELISRSLLKSRATTAYIHLQAMEVCLELNLISAARLHESMADYRISQDEQAKSREAMVMWKERQLQVMKEESRIKHTLSKTTGDSGEIQANTDAKKAAKVGEEEMTATHLGVHIGHVRMRDIWTDTAEILIRHALYQPAREMLNEAHLAAEAFSDTRLLARILYLLGRMAYCEAQYGQAVNFSSQAQSLYCGDEMFWYNTTVLIVDAMIADYVLDNRLKRARSIVTHALSIFTDISETRPNKKSVIGFIMASLDAKLGSIQADIAKEEVGKVSQARIVSALLSACRRLKRGAEQLDGLGYQRAALQVKQEHASILADMAKQAHTSSEQHELYIQAMHVYQGACQHADVILHDAMTTAVICDLHAVSLPVARECATVKLQCSSLMILMLNLHAREERQRQLKEQRKGSVLRAVEELIQEAPDITPQAREWKQATAILGQQALTMLTGTHTLVGQTAELKAQCLLNIGHCLRLLAVLKHPDPSPQWQAEQLDRIRTATQLDNNLDDDVSDATDSQKARYKAKMLQMKRAVSSSHQYLATATEVLAQAINLALSIGKLDVAASASLQLSECIGQLDPGLSSQYLALHQSCVASVYSEDLMSRALVDPTLSQQAALLHQRNVIMKDNVTTNASRGPVCRTIQQALSGETGMQAILDLNDALAPNRIVKQAWKRLAVTSQHLDLLKEFPPNFNFLVMQHSPDKNYLYGALLDKPRLATAAVGTKGKAQQGLSKAKVVRVETSGAALKKLLQRYADFKHDVMTMLLKQEYQRSQAAQRNKMLANLGNETNCTSPEMETEALLLGEDEARAEEEFLSLVQAMEEYLHPVTSLLDTALRPGSGTTSSENQKGKAAGETVTEKPGPQEYVILLADPDLMELPLECLSILRADSIASISREFSLQMLYHKIYQPPVDENLEKIKKEREKNRPPPRIPGLRDASKRQSKILPLDRPVPAGFLPVDTHSFRYFVDPYQDCSETEEQQPIDVFNTMMEEYSQQFTPRWLGILGNEHTPSAGEYEIYIEECSALVFFGMERFLSYLPPHKVAAMNLTECELVVLFDLAQTNKSFLRQSKIDVKKTTQAVSLEKPVETAVLLGLSGVKTVILNQWHCTLMENTSKLNNFMKDLLSRGQTTGATTHLLHMPHWRNKLPQDRAETANKDQSEKDKVSQRGSDPGSKVEGDALGDACSQAEEEIKVESEPAPRREDYNMICYGLPNFIVTQLTKQ